MIDIREHLAAFDGWLTGRLEEAHAARKDLAFRDLADDEPTHGAPWEYSLLEPGARSPLGEGWSVYRLNGVWPARTDESDDRTQPSGADRRRSLLGAIAAKVLGRPPSR